MYVYNLCNTRKMLKMSFRTIKLNLDVHIIGLLNI